MRRSINFIYNLFAFISSQITHFEEAVKEKHWVDALNQEIVSIENNGTWGLVNVTRDKTNVGVKWV